MKKKKAQNGKYLGTTNKGFDYNGAWGGPSMQKGGSLPPIYTSNPNDPRLRAYQDSLTLHKKNAFDAKYFPTIKHVNWSKDVLENEEVNKIRDKFFKEIPEFVGAYKRISKLNKKEPNQLVIAIFENKTQTEASYKY